MSTREGHTGMHRRTQGGFTLMELIVTMVLLVLLLSVSAPYVSGVLGMQVKTSARQLAGMFHYVYDEAGIKSTNFRVVFNLDRHSYYVEQCDASAEDFFGGSLLFRNAEDRERGLEVLAERQRQIEDYAQSGSTVPLEPDPVQRCKRLQDTRLGEVNLEDPVTLLGVWTPQYREIQRGNPNGPSENPEEDLLAEVYFLKGGYAERAFIYLSDGGQDIYTLELEPLTGHVTVLDGEVEIPREYWRQ